MADIREMVGSLSEALEKKVAEAEERSAQVDRMREELEAEKRLMSSLPPRSEVVEIDVGGEIFRTKRATLCAAEGSLLAAMFSGRWEESLDRDQDGRVFLDFDPAHFRILLNHLRLHRIAKPEQVRPPVQQPEHKELFDAMVDFLGVQEFLSPPCDPLECIQVGSPSKIRIDGHTITGGGADGDYCTAIGKAPLLGTTQARSVAWRVSFKRLQARGNMVAGIIANPSPGANSWNDATSYVWISSGYVWSAGQVSWTGPTFEEGDSAIFHLDAVGNRLRMCLERSGQIHQMALPEGVASQARLHFVLGLPGQEVVLSAVTADEVSRAGL